MTTVICHDIYGNQHETAAKSLQWLPAAYVVLIKDDSVCLLKAIDGHYDLTGGAIELGEAPKTAAVREVKEETGLDVDEPTLLGVESSLFRASHSDDRCYHSLLMYFHCTKHTGNVSNEGFDEYERQHMELAEWVPIENLDVIKVGSTVDFRPYVWQAYKMRTRALEGSEFVNQVCTSRHCVRLRSGTINRLLDASLIGHQQSGTTSTLDSARVKLFTKISKT